MSDIRSAIAARFSSDVHGTTAISPSLTMVGYGDHYPVTAAWRLVACRLMIPAFEQSARMSTSPVPTHVSLRSCCQGTTKEGRMGRRRRGSPHRSNGGRVGRRVRRPHAVAPAPRIIEPQSLQLGRDIDLPEKDDVFRSSGSFAERSTHEDPFHTRAMCEAPVASAITPALLRARR
jgi:hypothetical protein